MRLYAFISIGDANFCVYTHPIEVTCSIASPLNGQQFVLFFTDCEAFVLDAQAHLSQIIRLKIVHAVSLFNSIEAVG